MRLLPYSRVGLDGIIIQSESSVSHRSATLIDIIPMAGLVDCILVWVLAEIRLSPHYGQ